MQERAIVYFVVAYLACWLVDLVVLATRNPMLDPILKLAIVLVCLAVVLAALWRNRWLMP